MHESSDASPGYQEVTVAQAASLLFLSSPTVRRRIKDAQPIRLPDGRLYVLTAEEKVRPQGTEFLVKLPANLGPPVFYDASNAPHPPRDASDDASVTPDPPPGASDDASETPDHPRIVLDQASQSAVQAHVDARTPVLSSTILEHLAPTLDVILRSVNDREADRDARIFTLALETGTLRKSLAVAEERLAIEQNKTSRQAYDLDASASQIRRLEDSLAERDIVVAQLQERERAQAEIIARLTAPTGLEKMLDQRGRSFWQKWMFWT